MAAPMLPCVDRPKKVWYGIDDEWELLWIYLDMEAQIVSEQWLNKVTGKERSKKWACDDDGHGWTLVSLTLTTNKNRKVSETWAKVKKAVIKRPVGEKKVVIKRPAGEKQAVIKRPAGAKKASKELAK